MKKIRLGIIILILTAVLAVMSACSGSPQSSDIAGVYVSGDTTYIFAQDGRFSVEENGTIRYGYYEADNGSLLLKMEGENKNLDYTIEGDELSLFSRGSIFGVTYKKSADAGETIDGWAEPETLPGKTDAQAQRSIQETSQEISAETETLQETVSEPVSEQVTEPLTEAAAETAAEQVTESETEQASESATEPETEPETETETEPFVDTFVNQVKGTVTEGSIVTFGEYEQDNKAGADPIEWIVLKVDGNFALLVSRYGLDCQPFDRNGGDIVWDWSSIRTWLNDDFCNTAFNVHEQNTIQNTFVMTDLNPDHQNVYVGEGTEDKIFLLSTNQAFIYFNTAARVCEPTTYTVWQGAAYGENNVGCRWLLRTPGSSTSRITFVNPDGTISYDGAATNEGGFAIRPALRVRFR